jgi:hypothetical protein
VVAAAATLFAITGALSQDGPRAYHLLPQGTDILSLTTTILHGSRDYAPGGFLESSSFDSITQTPTYRASIDVGGNAGVFLIGFPVGSVSSSATITGFGTTELKAGPELGDGFIGGVVGLLDSPSLSPLDYSQYKADFRASIGAKLFLPTGAYDSSTPVNLGQNRWSLHASLPMSYVLGTTMIDPELTTFELTPSVQIFGDNEDPFGADVTSQAPLFGIEGHITRNFSPTVWGSLDGIFEFGGETSADGVPDGNAREDLSLGASLGLSLSPTFALRISYDEMVYSKVPDTIGRRFELTSAYLF